MDQVITGLHAATKLAEVIPVPVVKAVFSMALSVAELVQVRSAMRLQCLCSPFLMRCAAVQEVQDTRDGCKTLAERAAQHTLAIYDELARCGIAVDGDQATRRVEQLLGYTCLCSSSEKGRETDAPPGERAAPSKA